MNVNVKVRGPYFVGSEMLFPGSVVSVDEDTAKQMVKRGLGEMVQQAPFKAPPPEGHPYGTKADGTPIKHRSFDLPEPERQDLGGKLARAEQQVGRPQAQAR